MRLLLLTAWLSMFTLGAHAQESDAQLRSLYGHFVAPCCWTESLTLHDSPLAVTLREEIRARALRGETTTSIEQEMVARYGTRVLSTPPGYAWVAGVLVTLIALSGALLFRRRARGSVRESEAPTAKNTATIDALDARIDEELRCLEDA